MNEKPYSVKRYALRIFLPVAVVSVTGLVLRWQGSREFQEKNVAPVEWERADTIEEELRFSHENRAHVKAGLQQALQLAQESGKDLDSEDVKRLEESIEKLDTVGEEEWEAVLEEAYEALSQIR
ncbi:hypothetical protein QEH56_11850 [Pelagicoccus enzymogenes]|uniref:hypothetical protein n=1 Tax=Pelagicoccus enzymogenes TaxID=2773457 RepID=UPI00280D8DE3|nr:hypothetical protein [Pelagicoccus enzymogenes]MDQ8198850.1 hypothetical protein [Pelagicoccus enzymogenes]